MNDIFNKLLYNKEQANKKPTLIYKYYDNVAKEINTKIRMRGISKGFVCVQEDINKLILNSQKHIYWYTFYSLNSKKVKNLELALTDLKEICIDLDYLLKNKALTIGEIGYITNELEMAKKELYTMYESCKDNVQTD